MSARPAMLASLTAMLAAAPALAAGSPACFNRDILVGTLGAKYSEAPSGGGVQSQTQVIEVWSSPKTGTFTIFITQANGVSCVVATGQNWMTLAPVVKEGVAG